MTKVNERKKHLDAISTKIATFLVAELYADEDGDLQKKLSDVIKVLDEVAAECVKRDDQAA